MPRLPVTGSDAGSWGNILNDFLGAEHQSDGALKIRTDGTLVPSANIPKSALSAGVQSSLDKADSAIQSNDPRLSDARLTIKKTGTPVGTRKNLNLIDGSGINITAVDNGTDQVDVTIASTAVGGVPGHVIEDETAALAQRTKLSFQGTGVAVIDDAGNDRTVVTISAAGGTGPTLQKDGTTLIPQRPTLDFVGGPVIVDDAVNNRTRVFVQREYLSVEDPRIGISMATEGEVGAKLQAALDLAGTSATDSCVFIPAGLIYCNRQLNFPNTRSVRLLGAGAGISNIHFGVDLGAGTYAINLDTGNYPYRVEKLGISGPGTNVAEGSMPCLMSGFYCPGPGIMEDVQVRSFASGMEIKGGGQEWHFVTIDGCGYAMNWIDNPGGPIAGGYLVERSQMSGNKRASIAVADSASIVNIRFKGNGHFGIGTPFGIYRYANTNGSPPRSIAVDGFVMENWSFEYCTNGMIYDDPGDGVWKNIAFDMGWGSSTFVGNKWPGKPALANINVGHIDGFFYRGSGIERADFSKPHFLARSIKNVHIDYLSDLAQVHSPGWHPFEIKPEGLGSDECEGITWGVPMRGSGGNAASARVANESISKWDLIEMVGTNRVQRSRANATSQVVGISLNDYTAGQVCVYATKGVPRARNKTGTLIGGQGTLLKPDQSNIGGIVAASGPVDGPILGRVHDSPIAGGSNGPVMLMLG